MAVIGQSLIHRVNKMGMRWGICSAVVLLLWCGVCWGQSAGLADHRAQLKQLLMENILPFWYPGVVDEQNGGYRLQRDSQGVWRAGEPKGVVAQAQTLWFFSRLCRAGYGDEVHLEAARHGFAFLRERLWDEVFGGFFWQVNAVGKVAVKPHKHLFGQAAALYALSEYIHLTGDEQALVLARALFQVLEKRAYDGEHGGYREWFRRDWEVFPDQVKSYMGMPPASKSMRTHLYLLEALTAYYEVSRASDVRQRLVELIVIQSSKAVRDEMWACTKVYDRDWTPLSGAGYDRVAYGRNLENIWALIDACQVADIDCAPLAHRYLELFNYAAHYGYDKSEGGFFVSGPLGQEADERDKVWWVQAEALATTLHLYRFTGDSILLTVFEKVLSWVVHFQVDWQDGDWHWRAGMDGGGGGVKVGPWKGPFRNGRAVMECLEVVDSLQER
jgi:mannobiose 2-epimerase